MAAISGNSGAGGAGNIPSAGEMNNYSDKVNNMDVKSLGAELGKNLEPWQKDAVLKALNDKLSESSQGSGGAGGAGGAQSADSSSGNEKDELMKKLLSGNISNEEMQKLAKMMPAGTEVKDLEAFKGAGAAAAAGGSGGDNSDIQGG